MNPHAYLALKNCNDFFICAFIIIVLLLAILFMFSLKENSSKNAILI